MATQYGQAIPMSRYDASSDGSSYYDGTAGITTENCEVIGLTIQPVSGSTTRYMGYWHDPHKQWVDHYEVQWYYLNGKSKWIAESVQSVSNSSYTTRWEGSVQVTEFQCQYSLPSSVTVNGIKFRARPISKKRKVVVGRDSNGSSKYEDRPYFETPAWATSATKAISQGMEAPDAPTSLAVALDGTKAKLTWRCTSTLATQVVVYRAMDNSGWGSVATLKRKDSMSWTDSKCAVGHHYAYRLRALNEKSKKYSEYTSTVTVDEKPARCTDLKATLANETGVKLTWKNNGSVGTGFTVYYSDSLDSLKNNSLTNVQTRSFDGNMEKCQIEGLARGKTWYFRLKRKSSAGLGDYAYVNTTSKTVTASIKLAADPSTIVTVPATPTSNSLYLDSKGNLVIVVTVAGAKRDEKWEIQWSHVSGYTDDSTGSVSIDEAPKSIRRKGTDFSYGGAATGYSVVGTGVIYTMTKLDEGTTYYVRVRRVNKEKQSPWVHVGSIEIPSTAAPDANAPTLHAAYPNGSYIVVVFGNSGSRADETAEIQLSSVSGDFADDGVRNVTYSQEYRTVYQSPDGESYSHEPATGWLAWNLGAIFTITSVETGTKYWVRVCRKNKDNVASAWSETLTCTVPALPEEGKPTSAPTAPSDLTCEPQSVEYPSNIRLGWAEAESQTPDVEYASYEIQWTSNPGAFADNAMGDIESATWESDDPDETEQHYTITNLTRGTQWWFRVRKVNELGNGPWATALAGDTYGSETTCTLTIAAEADVLTAPTTVETLAGYELGDVVSLAWTHNSAQESEQSAWEMELRVTIDEVSQTGSMSGEDATDVIAIELDELVVDEDGTETTIQIPDGTLIEWRVRTQGVVDWSPWSGWRQFEVWAPPSVAIALFDSQRNDVADDGLTSMPFTIQLTASGAADANQPIEWWAEIVAAEDYDVDDYTGAGSHVGAGNALWRGSLSAGEAGFDPDVWERVIGVQEVRLQTGISYEVHGGCVTAQGIRADAEPYDLMPEWSIDIPTPTAEVTFDLVRYACNVVPWCMAPITRDAMESQDETVSALPATIELDGATIGDETSVVVELSGDPLGGELWELDADNATVTLSDEIEAQLPATFTVLWGDPALRDNTILDVYRIDSGGRPLLIAEGIDNDGTAETVDPHATYGTATYRIVATDTETGQQGAMDMSCPTPIDNVTIQWGEGEGIDDDETWETAAFAGHRVDLLMDLKLSESYSPDAVTREYAGRRHPVVYYGTQRGQKASLSSNVMRTRDRYTIAMLRKLADAMEPVYVRTPNGLGFWAHVTPNITESYDSEAVSVSLDVTRVETPEGEVP